MNSPRRHRFKVYRDEAKERHTSHWDWDYMSQSERDALLAEAANSTTQPGQNSSLLQLLRRLFHPPQR